MPDLNVTLIQTRLDWEDVQANLKRFDRLIESIEGPTDLIVLPEMFTTGFSMNAKQLAQGMDGTGVRWMAGKSMERQADVAGSMIIRENDGYFNRLVWARPDGSHLTYDKKHLFRYAGEDGVYTPGDSLLTVWLKGWKIRPFICYDLRFPVWARNTLNDGYDVALFVANWPQRRALHWRWLLQARAVENQCYVIGVNRIGNDGNGLAHSGNSSVIEPSGDVRFHCENEAGIYTAVLAKGPLQSYRSEFPFLADADRFTLSDTAPD